MIVSWRRSAVSSGRGTAGAVGAAAPAGALWLRSKAEMSTFASPPRSLPRKRTPNFGECEYSARFTAAEPSPCSSAHNGRGRDNAQ